MTNAGGGGVKLPHNILGGGGGCSAGGKPLVQLDQSPDRLLAAVLVFLVIYKLLPDRELNWLEALSGAIVSAVLWELGSYIFAKLVPLFDYQRIYGRMGAIVALMAWVYVASLIVLFGAHFSAQLHKPEEEQQEVFPHLEKTPTIDASTRKKLTLYSHQSQQR